MAVRKGSPQNTRCEFLRTVRFLVIFLHPREEWMLSEKIPNGCVEKEVVWFFPPQEFRSRCRSRSPRQRPYEGVCLYVWSYEGVGFRRRKLDILPLGVVEKGRTSRMRGGDQPTAFPPASSRRRWIPRPTVVKKGPHPKGLAGARPEALGPVPRASQPDPSASHRLPSAHRCPDICLFPQTSCSEKPE